MQLVSNTKQGSAEAIMHDMFSDYPIAGNVDDAGNALGVTPKTIRNLINKGELGSIRVGRAVRVTRDQLRAFVEAQEA